MTGNNDQVEILKEWWHSYGKIALYSFIVVVVAIVAWQTYEDRQNRIAEAASELYDNLILVVQSKDEGRYEKAFAIIAKLNEEHAGSVYSDYANLFSARLHVEKKEYEKAKADLTKTMNTSGIDIVKLIAKHRLVRILIMQEKYDEALAKIKHTENTSMEGEFYALEGDIYLKQGKVMEARKAYQKAVETGAASRDSVIQLKADSLGKSDGAE